MWLCDGCGAYCGCHPDTKEPLGTPAGPELRQARQYVHARLDPIWRDAWMLPCYCEDRPGQRQNRKRMDITRTARTRVYEFLADQLGLTTDDCHVGMFDIETCRRAWVALAGITYPEIRGWAHARRSAQPDRTLIAAE